MTRTVWGERRSPDTVSLLAALALAGIEAGITGRIPPSIAVVTSGAGGAVWAWGLTVTAGVALLGVLWRGEVLMGAWIEMAGRVGLALVCLGYGVAIIHLHDQWQVTLILAIVAGAIISCIWRGIQIARLLWATRDPDAGPPWWTRLARRSIARLRRRDQS